ncbi:four helix bundle protein [Opitutus sp. ER46]|uniref:four helix bundle protein n=1 Tax=Opitutus sp. ER46 TaxID=2161864 RepID=UPI000D325981|nr:four helix bundle protein [Opitutus sp. ER46]PTX97724.1 four helix bundle protein [Opitutus sp. ER46]
MAYRSFEELEVWQLARRLATDVYRELAACRDFGFRDQITRAACSISSNIAEGSERLHASEFVQFLGYAKGSAGETRNQLYLAADLGYMNPDRAEALRADVRRIGAKLYALIRSLQGS